MLSTCGRGGVLACLLACAACGTGSVEVVLDMPAPMDLAPAGATTVTLVAEQPGDSARATTATIADDGTFDLGKLPVVDGLQLSVVLRSPTQRVVGYGQATAAVDVSARDVVEVDVPMRRPFAYVTGATPGIAAFDTTLDSSQKKYQQTITLSGGADVVAAAGGDVWAISSASGKARRIAGATHQPDGAAVSLPTGVRDAVASSNGRWLVAGTTAGIAIADTPSGQVTMVAVAGGVDRVAIGASPSGGLRAIGLSGVRTSGSCATTSKLVLLQLGDTIGDPDMEDAHAPLADIAGSESVTDLVGVDPCKSQLLRLAVGGDASSVKLADVPKPTAAAMFGDRAWAIGSVDGVPDVAGPSGVIVTAGHPVLVAAPVDASSSTRADLPPVSQTAHGYAMNGDDLELSRNMNADTVTPTDIVVVPPGDQIAILYSATFHAPELVNGLGETQIPALMATTSEYMLLNASGGALVQRVLAQCTLTYDGFGTEVPVWMCEPASGADAPLQGPYTPGSMTVLYGGR